MDYRLVAILAVALLAGLAALLLVQAYTTDRYVSAPNIGGSVDVKIFIADEDGNVIAEVDPRTPHVLGFFDYDYGAGGSTLEGDEHVYIGITVNYKLVDMKSASVTFQITSGPGSPKSYTVSVPSSSLGQGTKYGKSSHTFDMGTVSSLFGTTTGTVTKTWGFKVTISGTGLDGKTYSGYKTGSCSLTLSITAQYVPTPSITITGVSGSASYLSVSPLAAVTRLLSITPVPP